MTQRATPFAPAHEAGGRPVYRPAADILEDQQQWTVLLDLPGTTPEQIDVRLEENLLTIRAQVIDRAPEAGKVQRREFGVGDFERSFRVSEQIDPAGIVAQYERGVLSLRLPKKAAVLPRKVPVSS